MNAKTTHVIRMFDMFNWNSVYIVPKDVEPRWCALANEMALLGKKMDKIGELPETDENIDAYIAAETQLFECSNAMNDEFLLLGTGGELYVPINLTDKQLADIRSEINEQEVEREYGDVIENFINESHRE